MMRFPRKLIQFAGVSLLVLAFLTRSSSFPPQSISEDSKLSKHINTVLSDAVSDILSREASHDSLAASTRIREIQRTIACAVQYSQWVRGSTSSQPSMRLLQRFTCSPSRFTRDYSLETETNADELIEGLCHSLRGKQIVLVGPGTSYYLHELWLRALAHHDRYSHVCPGAELCSWHQICLSPDITNPSTAGRQAPTVEELIGTNSSLLRFLLSSTLSPSSKPTDAIYHLPSLDPSTGIRQRETFWMGRAQSSQIVILNRPPVPAPAWTYDGSPVGNWSFASDFVSEDSLNSVIDGVPSNLDESAEPKALVIAAALEATVSPFLQSVLETLRNLQEGTDIRSSVVVWHGNWLARPSCFAERQEWMIQSNVDDLFKVSDPWVLYHNAQVYMQDTLLAQLLPHFNVTYLPLSIPLDSKALGTPTTPRACMMHPQGSPGGNAIASTFLGGLYHILQSTLAEEDL